MINAKQDPKCADIIQNKFEAQFEPEKPKLTVIKGGKNDNPIN